MSNAAPAITNIARKGNFSLVSFDSRWEIAEFLPCGEVRVVAIRTIEHNRGSVDAINADWARLTCADDAPVQYDSRPSYDEWCARRGVKPN